MDLVLEAPRMPREGENLIADHYRSRMFMLVYMVG
jgi:hypothetical protein